MLTQGHHVAVFIFLSFAAVTFASLANTQFSRKVCVFEGQVLSPGTKFKSDNCTTCRCPRKGGQVMCTVEDCREEPNCLRHSNVTSRSCCPRCEEYGCYHTNGHVYKKGEVISRDGCSHCYCPLEGGHSTCDVRPCPPIMCVDFVHQTGSCCPRCPNGSNCQLGMQIIRRGAVVTHGDAFCRCHLKRRGDNFKLEAVCYGSKGQGRESKAETFNRMKHAQNLPVLTDIEMSRTSSSSSSAFQKFW